LSAIRNSGRRPFVASTVKQFHDEKILFYPDNCRTVRGEVRTLGKIARKGSGARSPQAAAVAVAKEELVEQDVFMVDWCECGNLVTARARALQDPNPAVKKKCFNCLIHDRNVGTVKRTAEGWEA